MRKLFFVLPLFLSMVIFGQEKPRSLTTMSPFLSNSYYNFNFGLISYAYSEAQLEPGYIPESTIKNRFSGRILLGYKFNENLAIQYGVMRPASWFSFENINDIGYSRSVWFNMWSLSLKKSFNLSNDLSFYAELGVGNVSRVGFSIQDEVVYKNAHYGALVTGVGFAYRLNRNWDVLINGTYVPKSEKYKQPAVFQSSLGLLYNLKNKPIQEIKDEVAEPKFFFPKTTLQLGYSSNKFGFFANEFFAMSANIGDTENLGIPVFWLGEVKVKQSLMFSFQRSIFHTEKLFSLEWGASITGFQTHGGANVYALSVFPVLRFFVFRRNIMDAYINYSVIGPTFLSKRNIDGFKTGPQFTYQDFMGIGAYFGKRRNYNVEFRIMHYSNGNIFPENDGVDIPVMLTIGTSLN